MSKYSLYQLPCKTMISCGACPYRDRCTFVHDNRIRSKTYVKTNIRKKDKNNDDLTTIFYWPQMTKETSSNSCLYDCHADVDSLNYDYMSVYSMWNHFLHVTQNGLAKDGTEHCVINPYTKRPRLDIFVKLGNIAS